MAISRRLAVSAGLLCASGAWYATVLFEQKGSPTISNDIAFFVKRYDFRIPIEESNNLIGETDVLEAKLARLLSDKTINDAMTTINDMVRNDYKLGRTVRMNGWIVSETEFGLLVLRCRYV
ncbi:MAG: hypothetical protein VW124_12810 [Paracoccaceae bacterium]